MNRTVTTFWKRRNAKEFDAITRNSGRMSALHRVATLAKPALSHEGATSIDLGCGTGLFAGAVGLRSLIGVDFSEALLDSARERMETVLHHDILDLPFAACSIDNIVSLFVIDDYSSKKKAKFFSTVFSLLKPGGNFFFAAYSPHDERMGVCHEEFNRQAPESVEVCLEDVSSYKRRFRKCGLLLNQIEIITADGEFRLGTQEVILRREFIVMVGQKE